MPTNPDNMKTTITKNAQWWANNIESINQRFNTWLVNQ
jgi:hypothetical protein